MGRLIIRPLFFSLGLLDVCTSITCATATQGDGGDDNDACINSQLVRI